MADKYDVPAVMSLVRKRFQDTLLKNWNDGTFLSFIASLQLMYTELPASDRMLKDEAIPFANQHFKDLMHREDFIAVCKACGEIALDIMKVKVSIDSKTSRLCQNCRARSWANDEDWYPWDFYASEK